MNAEEYVRRELDAGRLDASHIVGLTRFWQSRHDLQIDGKPGPSTRDSIEQWMARSDERVCALWQAFMNRVLDHALAEVGNGETLGNNRGEAIYRYRRGDLTGLPWDIAGPWCASFVSYCLAMAAVDLKVDLPFETSRSAKTLTENVAERGRRCTTPERGALICWHRSRLGAASRRGHVAIVLSYDAAHDLLITIDGNKNLPGERWAFVETFTHPGGAWRRRLYLMATMAPRAA